jgi:hypothetical protein
MNDQHQDPTAFHKHRAYCPTDLFEKGMGRVIVARFNDSHDRACEIIGQLHSRLGEGRYGCLVSLTKDLTGQVS